jgi:hypothetical protein
MNSDRFTEPFRAAVADGRDEHDTFKATENEVVPD